MQVTHKNDVLIPKTYKQLQVTHSLTIATAYQLLVEKLSNCYGGFVR